MARAEDSGRAGVRRPTAPSRGTGRTQKAAGGNRAATEAMRAELRRRLEPRLAAEGFDLEDVAVSRAGSRSVVRVVVDRDGGIDLDAVADASRLVSAVLDDETGDGAGGEGAGAAAGGGPLGGAYVLEVTSPGVDRPLVEPRHWRRAVGRLVLVRRADGDEVEGRVLSADDEGADLAVPSGPARRGRPPRTRLERVVYGTVTRATVQVEFGSAADHEAAEQGTADEEHTDHDDAPDVGAGDDASLDVEAAPDGTGGVGGPAASTTGGAEEDHEAVGAEASAAGQNGKEMNR
ncbi:ribosome maturation factor RimP [Frankia sp. EI5c]|uniref:ribosome maturation factor RimP n=1 Tax=Frankia sp. EI5c TaxID=683316 RepID=UPI00082544FC